MLVKLWCSLFSHHSNSFFWRENINIHNLNYFDEFIELLLDLWNLAAMGDNIRRNSLGKGSGTNSQTHTWKCSKLGWWTIASNISKNMKQMFLLVISILLLENFSRRWSLKIKQQHQPQKQWQLSLGSVKEKNSPTARTDAEITKKITCTFMLFGSDNNGFLKIIINIE